MRVYIAGTGDDPRLNCAAQCLRSIGHEVVSQWHEIDADDSAEGNYADIDRADVIVAIILSGHRHQGLHAECGYAIGRGKRIYVVGNESDVNLMLRHPLVVFNWSLDLSWGLEPIRG